MTLRQAIDTATGGRDVILAAAESAGEVAAAWDGAVVVDARELSYDAAKTLPTRTVLAHAEALAGAASGLWCGPWHVLERLNPARETGIILHTHAAAPIVAQALSAWFDVDVVGELAAPSAGDQAPVTEEDVREAVGLAEGGPWLDAKPAMASLLVDLARTGHIGAVWNVPFLTRVADDRRFVEPFVREDADVSAFFDAHATLIEGLGMLEAAQYRFHGRQPKDLRLLARALELPLRHVARVFRTMDRLGVVVSKPLEEGAGARPNLELDLKDGVTDVADVAAAVADLNAIRAIATSDDEASSAPAPEATAAEPDGPPALASGLFASLADVPAAEPPAWPPPRPEEPAEKPSAMMAGQGAGPVPADLPDHLPGLEDLARGNLAAAREVLEQVEGELAAEAGILAAFRYELIDTAGAVTRRYEIPADIQPVVLRALELELVPESRGRAALDEEFPGAFAEVPRPGLIEVFYDSGGLAGTHRFTELHGRRAYEAGRLVGARAAQEDLAQGIATDDDPRDEGWAALAECLRLRDAREGEAAWEALQRVDVDVDQDQIREEVIALLPDDHEERVAQLERIEAQRVRRTLGPILEGIRRAMDARGRDDGSGHQAITAAIDTDLTEPLTESLRQRNAESPRDPGPSLWLGRLSVKLGKLDEAEASFRNAIDVVENPSRKAEWTFELGELALGAGDEALWWRLLRELLKQDPNPRAVDTNIARLFDDGLLTADHAKTIRKLLDKHGGPRRYPKIRERVKPPEQVDDWKKALVGLKLD